MIDVDKVIRFESGEMNQDEIVEWFQEMVTSGAAWSLQGFYGRTAQTLIDNGLVNPNVKSENYLNEMAGQELDWEGGWWEY